MKGSEGIEAVVVALARDPAVHQADEHGKLGLDRGAGWERIDGHGKNAFPADFERDFISVRDGVQDLEALRLHHLPAALRGLKDLFQVAPGAAGHKAVGELLLDDVGREELGKFFRSHASLDGIEVAADELDVRFGHGGKGNARTPDL